MRVASQASQGPAARPPGPPPPVRLREMPASHQSPFEPLLGASLLLGPNKKVLCGADVYVCCCVV